MRDGRSTSNNLILGGRGGRGRRNLHDSRLKHETTICSERLSEEGQLSRIRRNQISKPLQMIVQAKLLTYMLNRITTTGFIYLVL